LEKYQQFDHFTDFCDTFQLVRGKTTNEESESDTVGEFKVFKLLKKLKENLKKI
jgi:hypothetical protein